MIHIVHKVDELGSKFHRKGRRESSMVGFRWLRRDSTRTACAMQGVW